MSNPSSEFMSIIGEEDDISRPSAPPSSEFMSIIGEEETIPFLQKNAEQKDKSVDPRLFRTEMIDKTGGKAMVGASLLGIEETQKDQTKFMPEFAIENREKYINKYSVALDQYLAEGGSEEEFRRQFLPGDMGQSDPDSELSRAKRQIESEFRSRLKDQDTLKPSYEGETDKIRQQLIKDYPRYEQMIRSMVLSNEDVKANDLAEITGGERKASVEMAKFYQEHFESKEMPMPYGENYFRVDLQSFDSELSDELAAGNTHEEKMNIFKELHPNGMIFPVKYLSPDVPHPGEAGRDPHVNKLLYKENVFDLDEPFKEIKISTKDVLQEFIPELLGSIAASVLTPNKGLVVQSVVAGLGWIGGGAVDEWYNELTNKASQSEEDYEIISRLGGEGASVFGWNLLFGVVGRLIRGEPLLRQSNINAALLRDGSRLAKLVEKETQGTANPIKAKDALPQLFTGTLLDNPLAQAMSKQAYSMVRSYQLKVQSLLKQPKIVADLMRGISTKYDKSAEAARKHFQVIMQRMEKDEIKKIMKMLSSLKSGSGITPTGIISSKAGQEKSTIMLNKWLDKSKTMESQAWDDIDDFMRNRLVMYDFAKIKQVARELLKEMDATMLAKPSVAGEVSKKIIETPVTNKTRDLLKEIIGLHDRQYSYEMLNKYRKRIGALYDDAAIAGQELGQLDQIYKSTLEVIRNPEGLGKSAFMKYQNMYSLANARTIAKNNVLKIDSFRKLMYGENFGQFIDDLSRPNGISKQFGDVLAGGSDDINAILPKMDAQLFEYARTAARNRIISNALSGKYKDTGGMLRFLDDWQYRGAGQLNDRAGYKILFPDGSGQQFRQIAKEVDSLVNSGIIEASAAQLPRSSLRQFFGGASSSQQTTGLEPSVIRKYINTMNPRRLQVMQASIWDDFIEKSFVESSGKNNIFGLVLDPKRASSRIQYYKDTGLWASKAVNKEMRISMEGLLSYQRILSRIAPDVGVSLETAQLAAQLKNVFNPFSVFNGVSKMAGNKLISYVMRSRALATLLARGGKPINMTLDKQYFILANMFKAIREQADEDEKLRDASSSMLEDMLEKRLITYDEYLKRQGQP